jgi:hypothetical protein
MSIKKFYNDLKEDEFFELSKYFYNYSNVKKIKIPKHILKEKEKWSISIYSDNKLIGCYLLDEIGCEYLKWIKNDTALEHTGMKDSEFIIRRIEYIETTNEDLYKSLTKDYILKLSKSIHVFENGSSGHIPQRILNEEKEWEVCVYSDKQYFVFDLVDIDSCGIEFGVTRSFGDFHVRNYVASTSDTNVIFLFRKTLKPEDTTKEEKIKTLQDQIDELKKQ